jgi:hypothetical protein
MIERHHMPPEYLYVNQNVLYLERYRGNKKGGPKAAFPDCL